MKKNIIFYFSMFLLCLSGPKVHAITEDDHPEIKQEKLKIIDAMVAQKESFTDPFYFKKNIELLRKDLTKNFPDYVEKLGEDSKKLEDIYVQYLAELVSKNIENSSNILRINLSKKSLDDLIFYRNFKISPLGIKDMKFRTDFMKEISDPKFHSMADLIIKRSSKELREKTLADEYVKLSGLKNAIQSTNRRVMHSMIARAPQYARIIRNTMIGNEKKYIRVAVAYAKTHFTESELNDIISFYNNSFFKGRNKKLKYVEDEQPIQKKESMFLVVAKRAVEQGLNKEYFEKHVGSLE